jgi:hypothetical protein
MFASAVAVAPAAQAIDEFNFDPFGFDVEAVIPTPGASWDSDTGVVTVQRGVSFFDVVISVNPPEGFTTFGPFYDEFEQPFAIGVTIGVSFDTPFIQLATSNGDDANGAVGPALIGDMGSTPFYLSTMFSDPMSGAPLLDGQITMFGITEVDLSAGPLFTMRFLVDPSIDTATGPVDTNVFVYSIAPVEPLLRAAALSSTPGFSITVRVVPEPGTWALMVAGLGLAGFATRRRLQVH